MRVISLITDFGLHDWFVGTMKGVMLSRCPGVPIVDITHAVAAGDIRGGALALLASARFFPRGTVHVVVVDPGVGSERPALGVATEEGFLVGPDNGVLALALTQQRVRAARRLENPALFLAPVSRTFHGRDVFAPVAAHLAADGPFEALGPEVSDWTRLDWSEPRQIGDTLVGEVIHIDRFGNCLTNLAESHLARLTRPASTVRLSPKVRFAIQPCYAAVAVGQPLGVLGSAGYLEVSVNGGSAAEALELHVGARVTVH